MTQPAKTLKCLLGLILCTALGFAWGFTDGLKQDAPRLPKTKISKQETSLKVKLSLSQDEYRQGSSPDLLLDIQSRGAPIPRDVATWLRLQMAFPGGWDSPRALHDPEKVMIAVSDDGRHMQILVPVNQFQHSADQAQGISFNRFFLESIGDHELRIVLTKPTHQANDPLRFPSNPVRLTVVPNNLETVQHLPSTPSSPETISFPSISMKNS